MAVTLTVGIAVTLTVGVAVTPGIIIRVIIQPQAQGDYKAVTVIVNVALAGIIIRGYRCTLFTNDKVILLLSIIRGITQGLTHVARLEQYVSNIYFLSVFH